MYESLEQVVSMVYWKDMTGQFLKWSLTSISSTAKDCPRSRETKRYGVSAALLATRSGCPLVPIAHNAGFYWPRRGWLKRPGTVRFVIGAPIATEGRNPREINSEAQAWIESTIAAMADDGAADTR
jgi:1-acyl-sn-glycerol-3-phosphate acyltransferase